MKEVPAAIMRRRGLAHFGRRAAQGVPVGFGAWTSLLLETDHRSCGRLHPFHIMGKRFIVWPALFSFAEAEKGRENV